MPALARIVGVGLAVLAAACAATTTGVPQTETTAMAGAYVAHGSEPFWRLQADAAGAVWATPDGELRADAAPTPAPTPIVPGWRGLSVGFGGRTLTAQVTRGPCQDDMSGQFYPDRVQIEFGGQTYQGCGGAPLWLLTGDWRASANGAELGEVRIADDGALSGGAGCNRLMGQVTVTGEGIGIGPIAATRMACQGPAMAREATLATALERATRFSINPDGSISLLANDSESLRLSRP